MEDVADKGDLECWECGSEGLVLLSARIKGAGKSWSVADLCQDCFNAALSRIEEEPQAPLLPRFD